MDIPPLAVSIGVACRITGLGRSSIFAAIKRRELTARHFGRRTLLEVAELQRFVSGLPKSNGPQNAA